MNFATAYNYSPYYYPPLTVQRRAMPANNTPAVDYFTVDRSKTPKNLKDFEKNLDEGRFQDRWILGANNSCYAIPDLNQNPRGHCLIVPKRKVKSVFELSPAELSDSLQLARVCAEQAKRSYNNPNMRFKIETYEPNSVNHVHFHVLPVVNSGMVN